MRWVFLLALLFATPAAAQGVRQSGSITPGHLPAWATNGVLQDGGSTAAPGITSLGVLGSGLPVCINDNPVTSLSGYHQMCFGASSASSGVLSLQNYGGAASQPLKILGGSYAYTFNTGLLDTPSGFSQLGTTILQHTNNSGSAFTTFPTDLLIGYKAGASLNSADYLTVAIGWEAMMSNTGTNAESTAVGWHSQAMTTNGLGNTTLGINSLGNCNVTCNYNIQIGGDSERNGTTVIQNFGIGVSTLINDNGDYNMAMGFHTYQSNLSATGNFTIAIGQATWGGLFLTSGSQDIAIGAAIGQNATSASDDICIGHEACFSITSDTAVVSIGAISGFSLIGSSGADVFVGHAAAFHTTTGAGNTYVGYEAAFTATTDSSNTCVGQNCLYTMAGSSGANTAIGYAAGYGNTTGTGNTFLGYEDSGAQGCVTSGARNIEIGDSVCVPSPTSNYQLSIGNGIYGLNLAGVHSTVSTGQIGIMNAAPVAVLDVLGPDTGGTLVFRVQNSAATNLFSVSDNGTVVIANGVSCSSGVNTSTFRSVNGVVTHC